MEFRKQDLLHEIDVVWLSSLESSKLYASCMQCNAIFKSVIVLYFFRKLHWSLLVRYLCGPCRYFCVECRYFCEGCRYFCYHRVPYLAVIGDAATPRCGSHASLCLYVSLGPGSLQTSVWLTKYFPTQLHMSGRCFHVAICPWPASCSWTNNCFAHLRCGDYCVLVSPPAWQCHTLRDITTC